MTRRPDDWDDTVTCEVQNMAGETLKSYHGKIQKKSSDPADVIPDADIIVLCMPVHQYRDALFRLAPYIDKSKKEVFVGTIFGQAGFNWMVHEMEKEFGLSNTVAFAVGLIPWICRTEKYGSLGFNYGGKQVNIAAVTPHEKFDRLNEIFLDDICYKQFGTGRFVQACSFISLSLSVDNQVRSYTHIYILYKSAIRKECATCSSLRNSYYICTAMCATHQSSNLLPLSLTCKCQFSSISHCYLFCLVQCF